MNATTDTEITREDKDVQVKALVLGVSAEVMLQIERREYILSASKNSIRIDLLKSGHQPND